MITWRIMAYRVKKVGENEIFESKLSFSHLFSHKIFACCFLKSWACAVTCTTNFPQSFTSLSYLIYALGFPNAYFHPCVTPRTALLAVGSGITKDLIVSICYVLLTRTLLNHKKLSRLTIWMYTDVTWNNVYIL